MLKHNSMTRLTLKQKIQLIKDAVDDNKVKIERIKDKNLRYLYQKNIDTGERLLTILGRFKNGGYRR